MVCQLCSVNILDGSQTWGFHRPDYHNPNGDPDIQKCTFCSQLRQDVQHLIDSSGQTQNQLAIPPPYRWTIRSSPYIRENQSNRHTVITFRPVLTGGQDQPVSDGHLPTRTFYIFDAKVLNIPSATLRATTNIASPDGAGAQVRKWFKACTNHHERCSPSRITDAPAWVPTRLIDVTGTGNKHAVHVVHTRSLSSSPFTKSNYVTLSHCWGQSPMLMLTAETLAEFTDPARGIARDRLPRTFQQAIEVAREIGVRYIWIDSLCIIQASKISGDAGDFTTEGQLMHKVYRYSFCNIAAVDSGDSSGGLFRPPDVDGAGAGVGRDGNAVVGKKMRGEIMPPVVDVRGVARPGLGDEGDDEKRYVVLQDMWSAELLSGQLYTRGWVFQERMLAPRLLHFSSTQVFWDCATTSACEILPDKLPLPLDTVAATERHWREMLLITRSEVETAPDSTSSVAATASSRPPLERRPTGTADPSLETLWRNAVRKYTACNLTNYGSDRLAAIWGVAKLVRDALRRHNQTEEYGSGLWQVRLEEQLAWQVVDCQAAERLPELVAKHPSWSWASIRAEIAVPTRFADDRTYRVTDHDGEDIAFEVRSDEVEGQAAGDLEPLLVSKRLAVRGVIIPARWKLVGCSLAGCKGECRWSVEVDTAAGSAAAEMGSAVISQSTGLDIYPDIQPSQDGDSCNLVILVLGESLSDEDRDDGLEDGVGLVLDCGSTPPRPNGNHIEYRRLGTFRLWGIDRDELDKFHDQAVADFYLV